MTSRHSNCYVCGEAGHFKAGCPKKKDKQADKDMRKVRRLSQAEETHQLTCKERSVDGHKCILILDSVASISLFPAEMVKTRDGGKVTIVSSIGRSEVETAVVDIIVDG